MPGLDLKGAWLHLRGMWLRWDCMTQERLGSVATGRKNNSLDSLCRLSRVLN